MVVKKNILFSLFLLSNLQLILSLLFKRATLGQVWYFINSNSLVGVQKLIETNANFCMLLSDEDRVNYKNYKSKTMEDVSFIFIILQNLTCVAFLTYGCLLMEQPLIIANGIVQLQSLTLLGMKLRYDGNPFKSIEIKETEEIVIINNVPIKITTI